MKPHQSVMMVITKRIGQTAEAALENKPTFPTPPPPRHPSRDMSPRPARPTPFVPALIVVDVQNDFLQPANPSVHSAHYRPH